MLNTRPFRDGDHERREFLNELRNQARNMSAAVIDHILTEVEARGDIPSEWKVDAAASATDGMCAALKVVTALYAHTRREAARKLVRHAAELVNASAEIESKEEPRHGQSH